MRATIWKSAVLYLVLLGCGSDSNGSNDDDVDTDANEVEAKKSDARSQIREPVIDGGQGDGGQNVTTESVVDSTSLPHNVAAGEKCAMTFRAAGTIDVFMSYGVCLSLSDPCPGGTPDLFDVAPILPASAAAYAEMLVPPDSPAANCASGLKCCIKEDQCESIGAQLSDSASIVATILPGISTSCRPADSCSSTNANDATGELPTGCPSGDTCCVIIPSNGSTESIPLPTSDLVPTILVDNGILFPEAARWHDGLLYFSDLDGSKIRTVDLEGNVEDLVEVPGLPSGIGWLPNGDLLVVSVGNKSVYQYDGDALNLYADLSAQTKFVVNEMVVNSKGWAYVGDPAFFPFQLTDNDELGYIFLIKPDGDISLVSDEELWFPNGCVITPEGDTLIVAETFGNQLTAFDIASDGTLSNKRQWASFKDNTIFPDGLCQDEQGGIWVASGLPGGQWLRVVEGGEITDSLPKVEGYTPIGCQFGGPDRKTLFLLMSTLDRSNGRIDTVEVDTPGVYTP